ncbi:hypothetical protein P7C00_18675 [Pseudomonas sp. JDS08PS003]|uniref:hypothetical protein n=1 Tax=Pseudomonas TaxID=286 RepID=UPI00385757CE
MHYEHITSLEEFLSQVEGHLLEPGQRVRVLFPATATTPWDGNALARANRSLLGSVSGSANLYAIFTSDDDISESTLRYFGKTTKKLARQRVTNHLFRKHKKTGSKLANIMAHAYGGGTVEISWIEVHPESLRNYLEEELIHRHPGADWNRENRVNFKSSLEALSLNLKDTAG